jgi:hypothetical protein
MDRIKQLITLFEKVQRIHYKVSKFEEKEINERIKFGDCRHKSTLLYNLLKESGFEVKKVKIIFDWKDLPIPKEILSHLKESSTIWDHDAISVRINNKWIKVDCTWDLPLKRVGFPITKNWDGVSNTLQVTKGKLEFYDADKYIKDKRIKIIKEEAYAFAEALNNWFETIRKDK